MISKFRHSVVKVSKIDSHSEVVKVNKDVKVVHLKKKLAKTCTVKSSQSARLSKPSSSEARQLSRPGG